MVSLVTYLHCMLHCACLTCFVSSRQLSLPSGLVPSVRRALSTSTYTRRSFPLDGISAEKGNVESTTKSEPSFPDDFRGSQANTSIYLIQR
ncbi:hypothetical protein GGR54DRAFT_624595 [Hypoxylon sp. NC1633]|nr:hypothetical protein GGR54DRAFT_624595 [Hypoxylon sp. NC1633]